MLFMHGCLNQMNLFVDEFLGTMNGVECPFVILVLESWLFQSYGFQFWLVVIPEYYSASQCTVRNPSLGMSNICQPGKLNVNTHSATVLDRVLNMYEGVSGKCRENSHYFATVNCLSFQKFCRTIRTLMKNKHRKHYASTQICQITWAETGKLNTRFKGVKLISLHKDEFLLFREYVFKIIGSIVW